MIMVKRAEDLCPTDIQRHVTVTGIDGEQVSGELRQLYATADEMYLDILVDGTDVDPAEVPVMFDAMVQFGN